MTHLGRGIMVRIGGHMKAPNKKKDQTVTQKTFKFENKPTLKNQIKISIAHTGGDPIPWQ